MRVFAKSDKKTTLRKHTEDLFTVLNHIKKYIPEQIIDALKISVFFHDLGKVMPSFQIKEMDNKNYEPWDVTYEIPHSLFSVFLIDLDKLKNEYKNFIISAIAYHHWREDYEKYLKSRDIEFAEFCKKAIEWKDKLINNLLNEMSNLESYSNFITLNESWLNGIINGRSLTRYAVPPYKFDYEPLRDGPNKDWILLSGFLQRCDHFASYCEEEGENFDNVEIESILFDKLKKGIELDIKSKIKKEGKIWQFEKFEEAKGKNIVLVAPTGYGKTEFAFLWSHSKKFIYTLPLRSAVNQIFNRAENLFGNDKVGILYSDIDLYLITKKSEEEAFRTYSLSRQLSYPVIISTGDQFFPYALRPPGFEKIFSLFSYSDIVIDEVQAYEPKACAIVVKFLRWINFLGGRFLLMTATLPNFIMDAIKKDLEIHCINIYEEKKQDLSKIFKHKLGIIEIQNAEGSFEIPIEIIKAMINQASSGKRVLIILNTVEQSQEVYEAIIEQIKKDNINIKVYLLHSRFTINDRKKLEDEIFKEFSNPKSPNESEGKILIATQVIEASLDIDADIIYTEICPLDSLVQRMGRVLRRYFYIGDGKIINKSNEEEININREIKLFGKTTNVYLLVFKKGYESGKGRVYHRELIEKSIELLRKLQKSELSEYTKYEIVKKLYDELPKEGDYLRDFYQTLQILDAGYMSEKKKEALKIFREIYTVPAVPSSRIDDFKKSIEKFLQKNAFNYTQFKISVLSEYVVNIDIRKYFSNNALNLKELSYIVMELKNVTDDQISKLKKWLSGVYTFDGEYYEDIGVVFGNP